MIDSQIIMPDNTEDGNNSGMIKSVKDSIKSPLWNKLIKTIQSSNINIEKLVNDSIEYGLDVGIFQHSKNGKVVPLEILNTPSATSSDLTTSLKPVKHNKKQIVSPNVTLKSPLSESESFSCSSTAMSSIIQTRRSSANMNLKRSPQLTNNTSPGKKRKSEVVNKILKTSNISKDKLFKPKSQSKPMARPVPICAYCLGDELMNKRTKVLEDMISCWDCGTCAHPTCLMWPKNLLDTVRKIRWQCLQCKCCSYCGNRSKKDDDMLLCDSCDRGFHMYCFNPPIKVLPKGEWICRLCRPIGHHREKVVFPKNDFIFQPNCQMITSENVKSISISRQKVSKTQRNHRLFVKTSKIGKYMLKSRSKLGRQNNKMSLLHMKKKKLLEQAVQRQRSALTDGLSMFFTPSNKRQSRVSKQSLTSNSLNDLNESKSQTSSPRERSSVRSMLSRTRSKSPSIIEREQFKGGSVETIKDEINIQSEISCYESQTENSRSVESSSVKLKRKHSHSKSKEKVPSSKIENFKKTSSITKKKVTIELNTGSVAEASTTESSIMTMSKVDQSTSQSIMSTDYIETEPYPISDIDRQWYSEIQEKVAQLLPPPMDAPPELHSLNKTSRHRMEHSEPPELSMEAVNSTDNGCDRPHHPSGDSAYNTNQRFPPRIQLGKHVIDTWYSAPYPSEYARLNVLYVCEYCLKHIKSYDVYGMHMEKCTQHFPPGNEIYRNGDLSVFEVDGYISKLYCQQLCLLAKLFLDHKTLYYDVEPFLFYVAVISKNHSCHIIGYFSKEKRSSHKYNLSCIMILPPYQKYNYGRFLIEFSYLLSIKEGESGSPEKPLSTLGRLSYESYWKSKVIPYLMNREDVTGDFYRHARFSKPPKGLSITIDKISSETGINPHDVASTIQMLSKTVDLDESDRITIQLDWDKIRSESEKYSSKYPKWVTIDANCLRWAPLIPSNDKSQICPNQSINTPSHVNQSPTSNEKQKDLKSVRKSKLNRNLKLSIKKNSPISTPKPLKHSKDISIQPRSDEVKSAKPDSLMKLREKVRERSVEIVSVTTTPTSEPPPLKRGPRKRSLDSVDVTSKSASVVRQMITRHRSILQKPIAPKIIIKELTPINVDLTGSDHSDNQDNDDCVVILSPLIDFEKDWRKNKPVLEMFKDSIDMISEQGSGSKPSPPINVNEPSPVSSGQKEIVCPTLSASAEEEAEAELILGGGGRRPVIILEKCDLARRDPDDIIDLSADESRSSGTVVKAPSSKEDGQSSGGLRLPADISINDEFKRFFNDGDVFNSISSSRTDLSEKDADDSLPSLTTSLGDPSDGLTTSVSMAMAVPSSGCDSSLGRGPSPAPEVVSSTTSLSMGTVVLDTVVSSSRGVLADDDQQAVDSSLVILPE